MKKTIITLILLFIPILSHSDSSFISEDLEFIKFMQDMELWPKDNSLDNLTHTDIVKAKDAFKALFGIDYETAKNPPPPDSRFSSPENTWDLYKQALMAGDLDTIQSCLATDFAKNHIEGLKALGNNVMKSIAMEMQPIQKIEQDDNSAKYRIRQKEIYGGKETELTYYIYFVKIFGNWKIAQY